MKIQIVTNGETIAATLDDNAAARDFAALLPLDLTLRDYRGIERIADLPGALSTAGAPDGIDPDVGDIALYAPWGNLAIFVGDFGYSRGLVRLGRIDGNVERLAGSDDLPVRVERVDPAE